MLHTDCHVSILTLTISACPNRDQRSKSENENDDEDDCSNRGSHGRALGYRYTGHAGARPYHAAVRSFGSAQRPNLAKRSLQKHLILAMLCKRAQTVWG